MKARVCGLLIGVCGACGGCGDEAKPASDAGAPRGSGSAPPVGVTAAPAVEKSEVELLKFSLTSAVKDKDPSDKLEQAKPGQRVYGHLTVRNRTAGPKRVSLSFRVNGAERSMVDLTVEKSWSWRTWAYVTLRKDDKGELTVHAFDERGAELDSATIPIR